MKTATVTGEHIAQFHKLYREFKVLLDQSQAELAAARLNDDNEITIARNGQPVVIAEKPPLGRGMAPRLRKRCTTGPRQEVPTNARFRQNAA